MNTFGHNIRITLFGEAQGSIIGAVLDGLPWGEDVDQQIIADDLSSQPPGTSELGGNSEPDTPVISSGFYNGKTTGAPLCILLRSNTEFSAAGFPENVPRPGHADLSARIKFGGYSDPRGGGVNSGRLMTALVAAGSVCRQILDRRGINITSKIVRVGPYAGDGLDYDMRKEILDVRASGDSVGSVVECMTSDLPAGIGGLMFAGLESAISAMLFAIPGVRGVEFGAGFSIAEMRGSAANDPIRTVDGQIYTETNHSGGINGGISNGMPIIVRCAFRPTPSIGREQKSVDLDAMENTNLRIRGRVEPCLAPKAIPAVEAAMAFCILDAMSG